MSSPEVAAHLVTATGAIDEAKAAVLAASGGLDEAVQACEAAGAAGLAGSVSSLRGECEAIDEKLDQVRTDVDAERQNAESFADEDEGAENQGN